MEWMILPFKRYFDFSGRSRRKEYWMFTLLYFIILAVSFGPLYVSFVSLIFEKNMDDPNFSSAAMAEIFTPGILTMAGIGVIFLLASFIPSISVTVRRLHDRNMSGWWYFGFFVASMFPFLNIISALALIVVMCLEGTRGPNQYGEDPKNPNSASVFS